MISLWQMTVIREIMKNGSISAAARQLGRTQPAISATVKELENNINFHLFKCKKGHLMPMPETFFLLEKATEILEQVDELHQLLQAGVKASPTKMTMSSMPVLSEHFLPGVIANFSKNHPKAGFQIAVQKSPEVISSLEAQRFDIGLAERREDTELIKCRRLDVDCVCALPSGDPLLRKSVMQPNDLAGRPCASFLPEHHITKALKIAFDSAGVPFDPKFQMQNGAAQYEIIGSGAACSVFSPLTAWIHRRFWRDNRSLEFRRFSPKIPYHFSIITPKRRSLSQAALAFVEALEIAVSRTLNETRQLVDDVSY